MLLWGETAQGHIRAVVIVGPHPTRGEVLNLFNTGPVILGCRACSKSGRFNAACEGFFGRLKTELFYPRNWQDVSIDQFIQTVDAYIRWYNEKRVLSGARNAEGCHWWFRTVAENL
jgi:hypothetical protein